jgi:hypothetical protein
MGTATAALAPVPTDPAQLQQYIALAKAWIANGVAVFQSGPVTVTYTPSAAEITALNTFIAACKTALQTYANAL